MAAAFTSSLLSYLTIIVVFLSIISKEYAVKAFVPPVNTKRTTSSCSISLNKRNAYHMSMHALPNDNDKDFPEDYDDDEGEDEEDV